MSENIMTVNQDNFQTNVLNAQKPVMIDFWAPWCGPCRAVTPIVEELAKEYDGKASFAKINVDEAPMVASKYGIMSIPTILVFKDGKPAAQLIGYRPKNDFKKILDNVLKQ